LETYNIIKWIPRAFHFRMKQPELKMLMFAKEKGITAVKIEDLFENVQVDEKELLRVELVEKAAQHAKDNAELKE